LKKIFLDANIVLDFLDSTRDSHNSTKKVFEILIDQNSTIVISEDILTTIYYVVKNKHSVHNFFETIITSWEIVSFGSKVISNGVAICKENLDLDFVDVIQSLCAKEYGCSLIISNDKNFYNSGVSVLSSEKFISLKY
jgi:predicted nucleic acid-binding protein